MSFSLAGKSAIVTGADEGIGLAIARHFVAEGANVMLAGSDEVALQAALADLGSGREHGPARSRVVNLRERLSISNLVSATIDAFDGIDILINAAREVAPSEALDPEADQVEPMLEVNLLGALRLSQAVARRMIARAEAAVPGEAPKVVRGSAGAIVNLSSIAASRTFRGMMGFAVATAALDQMTRSLAVALAGSQVRVNGLAFASLQSPALLQQMQQRSGLRQDVLAATPLGRIALPAEIVHAAQFLASEASGFMTGQILTVDGGRSLLDPVRLADG